MLLNAPLARDDPSLLLQLKSRQTTPADEAASEHNLSLCSNPRLDASPPLRGRWHRKGAQVKASHSQVPPTRAKRPLGRNPALLKGLIFGQTGAAMTPAHTRKNGKLYRYYVSSELLRTGCSASSFRRLPAAQIEDAVVAQIRRMVQTPEIIMATWRAARKSMKGLAERDVREALFTFESVWSQLFPAEQARIIQLLVDRVDILKRGPILRFVRKVSPA
jgi:hypothetical protein